MASARDVKRIEVAGLYDFSVSLSLYITEAEIIF